MRSIALILTTIALGACEPSGLNDRQRDEVVNLADDVADGAIDDVASSVDDHEDRLLAIEERLGI